MTTFTTQDRQDAQRTPLTEEKLDEIENKAYCRTILKGKTQHTYLIEFARAIERAHGIGE